MSQLRNLLTNKVLKAGGIPRKIHFAEVRKAIGRQRAFEKQVGSRK